MDALIKEAKRLGALALDQADEALATIHEAQRVCEEVLNGNA